MPKKPEHLHDPYCGNCGYKLAGLVDSSKCPECGKPLVEVVSRTGQWGRRYRSKATLLGLPVIDIAFGPRPGERIGKARGFIAIGDQATGVLAIGGLARGLVAIGGMALGVCSMGGMGIGLLSAVGGGAIGGIAAGGGAGGAIASGGFAAGLVANGGGAVGYFARGGGAYGAHTIGLNTGVSSPQAANVFDSLWWFFGPWPPDVISALQPLAIVVAFTLGVSAVLGLAAWLAYRSDAGAEEQPL